MFGKKKSKQDKIHSTKAGRVFDDAVREIDRNRRHQEQDELAARRAKNGGRK